MAKIIGICSINLKTNQDKEKLCSFYESQLGLSLCDSGINISGKDGNTVITLTKDFDTFPKFSFYVDNLKEMIKELKGRNVEIVDEITKNNLGLIAIIKDTCGNLIELVEQRKM